MAIRPNPGMLQINTVDSSAEANARDLTGQLQADGEALGDEVATIGGVSNSANEVAVQIANQATPDPTPDTFMKRDAEGQAKVADPTAPGDIATKRYVDGAVAAVPQQDLTGYATTGDLPAYETTSGPGWSLYRYGRLVEFRFTGLSTAPTIPAGYRPSSDLYFPIAFGKTDMNARGRITSAGAVAFFNATTPWYGQVTYIV